MTNVLIGYTGNVCSTPMVEYARLIEGVWVPILEQFDEYQLLQHWHDRKRIASELANVLEALYQRRSSPYMETPSLLEHRDNGPIPTPEEKQDLVFKWRPISRNARGSYNLRRVFSENEVRPAVIVRRSLSEQALKVYLSEKVYQSRHQQFAVAKLSEQEYADYLREQAEIRVTLSNAEMVEVGKIAKNFLERTHFMLQDMSYYFPAFSSMPAIIAEDVFTPGINADRYQTILSQLLERPVRLPKTTSPSVRKGGLNIENCENCEEVLFSRGLVRLERKYEKLLARTDVISQSTHSPMQTPAESLVASRVQEAA